MCLYGNKPSVLFCVNTYLEINTVKTNQTSNTLCKISSGEYLYKPWAFDTILIYLYLCVILVSVNISE